MAFPKRGSRFIVVDGIKYRWRFPPRPTQSEEDGWPGVMITVSPTECDGATLLVGFPNHYRLDGPCGFLGKPILPAEVALRIREAVAAGWPIDQPGKRFTILVQDSSEPTKFARESTSTPCSLPSRDSPSAPPA